MADFKRRFIGLTAVAMTAAGIGYMPSLVRAEPQSSDPMQWQANRDRITPSDQHQKKEFIPRVSTPDFSVGFETDKIKPNDLSTRPSLLDADRQRNNHLPFMGLSITAPLR